MGLWGLGGFSGGSLVKNLPTSAGDTSLILGLGGSSGEGNGNPLQYTCLENPMDRGAWWGTVCGVAKESDMTQRLNNNNNGFGEEDHKSEIHFYSFLLFKSFYFLSPPASARTLLVH